ncbi:unnamed protein product [Rodentolepis nana]|uniref:Calpain_III domain-containing protein n=1 Tax=Rodentolepis nana TaxID=102285 RepID=A0A0R3T7F7_RODNA|nr:unnamed protein product [Rodentolepis nana]
MYLSSCSSGSFARWGARWDVGIEAAKRPKRPIAFYFNVATMTQGFIGCMFVISKRLGIEMPSDVIQFDPEFYEQLPTLSPSNGDDKLSTLIEAPEDQAFGSCVILGAILNFTDIIMNLQYEKSRILEFLNSPSGRHLFQIRANFEHYLLLGTLPTPGGYAELTLPSEPQIHACWDLTVDGNQPPDYQANYLIEVRDMTQGFMGCVFVLSRWYRLEMPHDLIQFDPSFYRRLHSLIPQAQYIARFVYSFHFNIAALQFLSRLLI